MIAMDPRVSTGNPASKLGTEPDVSMVEAVNFFSLPLEVRNMIYCQLFQGVYSQIRADAKLCNLLHHRPYARKPCEPSQRLSLLQASHNVWEEGSRIFYGMSLFRFHVGSENFNDTPLTRRTANLMQDVEISLYSSKYRDGSRVLRLFGYSRKVRKSCIIKLQFRRFEDINENYIEALRRMTGFKVLIFETEAPVPLFGRHDWRPGAGHPLPWISELLRHLRDTLAPALGPSTYTNDPQYRRLTFKPCEYENRKGKAVILHRKDSRMMKQHGKALESPSIWS